MTYVITQTCVGTCDTACVDVCPVDCIHGPVSPEQMFIDPDACTECGACIAVCPVDAIGHENAVPADDVVRNARFFRSRV